MLRASFDPTLAPSLSGLSRPSVTLSRLDSISHEGPFRLSVECLESPQFTKSQWFVLKLLLCPQGEQGEDGKAEGPPGPPGDPVRPPNFHPLDQGQGGAWRPAVWGGEGGAGMRLL